MQLKQEIIQLVIDSKILLLRCDNNVTNYKN